MNVGPLPTIHLRPASEGRDAPALPRTGETPVAAPTTAAPVRDPGTPPATSGPTIPKTYTFIAGVTPPPPSHPQAAAVVAKALEKLGQPYLWGGEGDGGFDCSGLSKIAWLAAGITLPHQSQLQFNRTVRVNLADIAPGDLLFFGDPIHHLGLYVGDGTMIEAPKPGIAVRVVPIKRRDLVGIGRVVSQSQ